MRKFFKITFSIVGVIIAVGYLIPERKAMPCCTPADYNHQSFWHWPWTRGEAGCPHTGIDIFGKVGTPVVSQTGGIVIYAKEMPGKAGNSVFILGPKWRIHYYAHLNEIKTNPFSFVTQDTEIGTVGNTGNAATTPAHLHYGIGTLIPYPWRIDDAPLGHQKAFYLNPIDYLK